MENSSSVCHSEGKGKECSNIETSVVRLPLKIVLCTYRFFPPTSLCVLLQCYYAAFHSNTIVLVALSCANTAVQGCSPSTVNPSARPFPPHTPFNLLPSLYLILQLPQRPRLYPLLTFPFFPFPFISASLFSSHFLYRAISTIAGALGPAFGR